MPRRYQLPGAATFLVPDPGSWRRQLRPAERAHHGPWPLSVPVALGTVGASVAQPPERPGDVLLDQLLQNLAHPAEHVLLERIEPVLGSEQIRRSHGGVCTAYSARHS